MLRRNDVLQRAALITFIAVAFSAVPAYLTGEPAESVVEQLAPTAKSVIAAHEEAATVSFIAVEVLGALALAALLLARSRFNRTAVYGALTVAAITAGLMAWTANLGGRIRHPEVGAAGSATRVERHETHESEGR